MALCAELALVEATALL